jgi:hypothetical protein
MPFVRYVTSAVPSDIARVWLWTQASACCRRFNDVRRPFRNAVGTCQPCGNSGELDVSSAIPLQLAAIAKDRLVSTAPRRSYNAT